MSFLPSASPPAVHQLKNSNLPLALGSGLMPSAARAAILSPPDVPPPAGGVIPTMASVGVSMASRGVLVAAAAAGVSVAAAPVGVSVAAAATGVSVAAGATGGAVGVSAPQAASIGMRITARAATQ